LLGQLDQLLSDNKREAKQANLNNYSSGQNIDVFGKSEFPVYLDTIVLPEDTIRVDTSSNTQPDEIQDEDETPEVPTATPESQDSTDESDEEEDEEEESAGNNQGNRNNNNRNNNNRGGTRTSGSKLAIVASFEMKKIRQRGNFKIDLNKWTSDVITARFDENIGNLTKYMDDPMHFRQINLDDPLYRQREIVAFIDGYNAADFKEYINFVSVHLRKKHDGGDLTDDEVRIDRYNFNDNGNYFKMLYGWKGDNDRDKWMKYDYEVMWSFFGDHVISEDYQSTTFNAINLSPPLSRRTVELQADASMLEEANVRLVTVKLYNKVGEKEYVKQASLNPSRDLLSQNIDYLAPNDNLDYEYEVTWRIKGNKVVNSGRLSSSESILFVDELPE